MAMCAVRYCIGRMTYVVSDCCDWLRAVWPHLREHTRNIIRRDIDEAIDDDDKALAQGMSRRRIGMQCDSDQWRRVARDLWSRT